MKRFIDITRDESENLFSKGTKKIINDVPDRVTDVPDGHVIVPDDVPDRVTDVPDGHVVVPDNVPTLTLRAKNEKIHESKELNLFDEIKKNPRLDIKEYSRLLNVTSRSIKRYLSLLKHKGYIERYGTNKNGYWKIKK